MKLLIFLILALTYREAVLATTVCEQLVLPNIGPFSWAPYQPVRLSVRTAFALGKRMRRSNDSTLLRNLDQALPGGFMIVGTSVARIRTAVAMGRFTGREVDEANHLGLLRRLDLAESVAADRTTWLHGITAPDLHAFGGPAGLLVAREAARTDAEGSYLLEALRLNANRYAALIPILSQLAQGEGASRSLRSVADAMHPNDDVRALIVEAIQHHREPDEDQIEAALERRGFLIVFRDSSYTGRAHVEDPEGPGSVVAVRAGRGLTQSELYAIIPQSSVDQADFKQILSRPPAR